uniref:Uncharacterized protein n=1 Tax=Cynoglossus semilaevis TaxID=244447 RepID=A0A3P8VJ12_CYNSE
MTTMPSSIVLFVIIYLCGLQHPLGAMPTCRLQRNLVQSSQKLLADLGPNFPVHCSPYNVNITFPTSILPAATSTHSQCRKVLWVVHETLNGTREVFSEYNVKEGGVNWNLMKLSTFRNLQKRLLDQGQCLSGSHVLDSYFADITALLQHKHSATCGWMALRRDVLWVLRTVLMEYHGCFI